MKYLLTAIAIVLAFAAGAKFATVRNDLAARRNAISQDRTDLDSAFEARASLISDLAAGAPAQLAPLKAEVAGSCDALQAAQTPEAKTKANDRLSASLVELQKRFDVSDVKDDLAAAEDRIADEREKYNGELEHYNAILQTFPVNLVATITGYGRSGAYFKTGPAPQ